MYLAGLPSSTTDWTVNPHPVCTLARPGGTRSVVKFTDACSNSVEFLRFATGRGEVCSEENPSNHVFQF
jgi:hypothetical protein